MNTQQSNVNTQMANAMHAAAITAVDKVTENAAPTKRKTDKELESTAAPMLIPCTDLLGTQILVVADSLDVENDTVQYYDLKKGNKPHTVSAAYYKSANKLKDTEQVTKLVQTFSKATGVKSVILRERLVKESAKRVADPSIAGDEAAANKEFADKLVDAISKAVYRALAVN